MAQLRGIGPPLWAPHPDNKPQIAAYESLADETLFGGAAGGGKTDLLVGTALTHHRRSIIFRREYEQLKGIIDRTREVVEHRGRYNGQDKIWRLDDGRVLELGAVKDPGDEQKFQGRPHDFKGFDELAHFTEGQYRFLIGWNRTADPDQRCRVIAASNPPATAEGEWIIRRWAAWLDPNHPNPAKPGELRWYATIDGKDCEVPGPEPFEHNGEMITPRSRTFIPARVQDNPYLMATEYVATLQALPEPLRSMMLEGRFDVGREDDPWQVIPTAWIRLAQERWERTPKPKLPMLAAGVDVAAGGEAETVISPRRGVWFDEQIAHPGKDTPDGPVTSAAIISVLRDGAQVNIDVSGGWGNSAFDHLKQAGVPVYGCNGAMKSEGRSRDGKLGFRNKRAEWWWSFREALDPDYGEDICLPPDPGLRADLAAPRWVLQAGGMIKIESKPDIIKRLGRSPDKGDSAVYSLADESLATDATRRKAPAHSESGYDVLAR